MALTSQDKERCRYHCGYLEVSPAASLSYGIPRPINTIFLIETAMDNIVDLAIPRVIKTLNILDKVECKLEQALEYMSANKIGNIEVRADQADALEREYHRWAARLCDILGVPPYPYAERNREAAGVMAGNVKVQH